MCSNRLLGVVRNTGALVRASYSCRHLQTVQLHKELNKDNFTTGFFVSFIMTVFVPDVEGIQNKVI